MKILTQIPQVPIMLLCDGWMINSFLTLQRSLCDSRNLDCVEMESYEEAFYYLQKIL